MMQTAVKTKKPRKQAVSGRFWAMRTYRGRIKDDHKIDPACGSGNFLAESYQCLRRLENRVLIELSKDGQISFDIEGTGEDQVKVSLANFHGIEINDFACAVARTALWIAEKQADADTASIVHRVYQALPLTDYGNVRQGNALRIDWNDVVPADRCSFICGNPPFIGQYAKSSVQAEDARLVWGNAYDGNVDYVACWHKKASDYMLGHHIRSAFVSTNSICQGLQVAPLWTTLFSSGVHIDFAHRTFVWDSQADDVAHVHVIIIGFSREDVVPRLLFEDGVAHEAANINAYLLDAPDVIIRPRKTPLSNVPHISKGLQPTDGGNLIIQDRATLERILSEEPDLERYIHRYVGSTEFINDTWRWCFWLKDVPMTEYDASPILNERLDAVQRMRSSSSKASTRNWAAHPELFTKGKKPEESYVIIPSVSSERRDYVPMGFLTPDVIPSNLSIIVPGATLWHFGVLQSQFHNAWMRTVAGRLKSDYRYGGDTVYNTFPWPDCNDKERSAISQAAQDILDFRQIYAGQGHNLAFLYDPDRMPRSLKQAHRALDAAVEAAYGVDFNGDEEKIVAHLFKLYAEKTS